MTIFFYKWLTRKLEVGNTPVWDLPNIWRLGWVNDTKFGTNVSSKMLLNAAKWQGYTFYGFWVIKGKPTVGYKINPPHTLPLPHTHSRTHIRTHRHRYTHTTHTHTHTHKHTHTHGRTHTPTHSHTYTHTHTRTHAHTHRSWLMGSFWTKYIMFELK